MSKGMRTEDEVRDSAKLVLGFDKTEDGVQQGTGQITTFNQLGFRGCNDKPDGWYLPDDASKPAIILETKSETEGVSKEKHVKELFKNIDVVAKKYSKTISMGNKFDRSKMCEIDEGINFVGRSALTNGVACAVTSVEDKKGNIEIGIPIICSAIFEGVGNFIQLDYPAPQDYKTYGYKIYSTVASIESLKKVTDYFDNKDNM